MSDAQPTDGAPDPEASEATEPPTDEALSEPDAVAESDAVTEPEALIPTGNRLRLVRGSVVLAIGAVIAFVVMALQSQFRFGVPVGAFGVLLATFGILDLLGSFDDPEARVAGRATLASLARPLALFFGGLGALFALLCLAVDGRLHLGALPIVGNPIAAAGVLIPAAFLTALLGGYRIGERLDVWEARKDGTPRPLLRRHGFWLVLTTTLLYLPVLGSHSLSDPWETHYGEVAREILARNDWISLWWAQDGWFWSKPVLDFWLQALAMAAFGVRFQPDAMLSAAREGRIPWPEWAVRLPIFLLTLLAVYLLYKAVSNVFGRRAGLLGGIVLVTMPQWFLVTHQTMTDMPFVAPMAAAMALLLLGLHSDPDEEVRVYELDLRIGTLRLSGYHLVLGAVIACALPQILYLFSRNLAVGAFGLRAHFDAFAAGSPGNCGLPANEACRAAAPVIRGLHPALQALVWVQALALILYLNWGERRRQRLYFLAAWLFAALSTMAKGPAGFLLPTLCALAYVVVSKRYRDVLRMEITSGMLILLAVALPWLLAMYARHGQPFTDRLLFHDMFKRAFTHVHDTNEGDDVSFRFYVWQLGYAMFPWTGLAPAGLLWWLRRREEDRRSDASVFLAMWFLLAFSLFSLMLTKFHHYILPALPPAAMLIGVLLDAMWRRTGAPEGESAGGVNVARRASTDTPVDLALYAGGIATGTLLGVLGAARLVGGMRAAITAKARLVAYFQALGFGLFLTLAGAMILAMTILHFTRRHAAAAAGGLGDGGMVGDGAAIEEDAEEEGDEQDAAEASLQRRFERAQLGAVGVAGALLVFFVGRDLSASFDGGASQIRLLHLFSYNYRRAWPASLDFTPTLWAFTAVAATLTLLLAAARIRRHVVAALVALSIVFAAWGLDVYFMKTSPHWGQRETVMAYYQSSRDVPGPLIAYQMNWKGENFYTGNHLPAFVSSGKKFQDYVAEEKRKGTKTFYLMTEHGRVGSLQNEIGTTRSFEKLTTPELNNKFLLVRATFE